MINDSFIGIVTADDGRRHYDDPVKIIGTDTEHVMDFFTINKDTKTVKVQVIIIKI